MTPRAALSTLAAEVTDATIAAHRRRMRGEHFAAAPVLTPSALVAVLDHILEVSADVSIDEEAGGANALSSWDGLRDFDMREALAPWRTRLIGLLAETSLTPGEMAALSYPWDETADARDKTQTHSLRGAYVKGVRDARAASQDAPRAETAEVLGAHDDDRSGYVAAMTSLFTRMPIGGSARCRGLDVTRISEGAWIIGDSLDDMGNADTIARRIDGARCVGCGSAAPHDREHSPA